MASGSRAGKRPGSSGGVVGPSARAPPASIRLTDSAMIQDVQVGFIVRRPLFVVNRA